VTFQNVKTLTTRGGVGYESPQCRRAGAFGYAWGHLKHPDTEMEIPSPGPTAGSTDGWNRGRGLRGILTTADDEIHR